MVSVVHRLNAMVLSESHFILERGDGALWEADRKHYRFEVG